jgi:hypothetical protein
MEISFPVLQFDRQAAFGGPRGRTNDRRVWNILMLRSVRKWSPFVVIIWLCPTVCIKSATASVRGASVKAVSYC